MKEEKFSIIACLVPTIDFDKPGYFHVNTFYYGNRCYGFPYLCRIDLYLHGSSCYIVVRDEIIHESFGFKLKPILLDSYSYSSLRSELLDSYLDYYSFHCFFQDYFFPGL